MHTRTHIHLRNQLIPSLPPCWRRGELGGINCTNGIKAKLSSHLLRSVASNAHMQTYVHLISPSHTSYNYIYAVTVGNAAQNQKGLVTRKSAYLLPELEPGHSVTGYQIKYASSLGTLQRLICRSRRFFELVGTWTHFSCTLLANLSTRIVKFTTENLIINNTHILHSPLKTGHIADKPRDAFVLYTASWWPRKHVPPACITILTSVVLNQTVGYMVISRGTKFGETLGDGLTHC